MGLMDSLGLDKVSGKPQDLPVGKYDGVVAQSEYVHFPNKNSYNHVISYQVTSNERKGGRKQEVFTLGDNPQFDEQAIAQTEKRWSVLW